MWLYIAGDPKSYVTRYHEITFLDPVSGIPTMVDVTGYGSGWDDNPHQRTGSIYQKEYNSYFVKALRMFHHGNPNTPCGSPFYFNQLDQDCFDPNEEFYANSFVRAFVGKGSPDEITDTLRVALAIGRIGTDADANGARPAGGTAQDYCKKFMTLDCNGLTGNYHGINPETEIKSYANIGRKRSTLGDIQQGDVLITIPVASKFDHIALVHDCTILSGDTGSTSGLVSLEICEWGAAGGRLVHMPNPAQVTVQRGAIGEYGLGYQGDLGYRYFFAPPQGFGYRGWGLNGNPAG